MKTYKELLTLFETQLSGLHFKGNPQNLYDPMNYMLSLGGKRLRPVLTLMANDMFGGKPEQAMPAALAVEVFHNFTLVHDDIMDKASIRRGQPTVHKKWNETVAILSGDLMMIKAIDLLCEVQGSSLKTLVSIFNKAAAEVCEGQQIDMNFETMDTVSADAYIEMITLKTAVLLGASLQLGAVVAGASDEEAEQLYLFGKHIGIAFQIQDDILDSFGEGAKVGKQIGGDIAANKKTLLLIEAQKLANAAQQAELKKWLATNESSQQKIDAVLNIYRDLNVLQTCEEHKQLHLHKAFAHLDAIHLPAEKKAVLRESAIDLMNRMS